MSKSENSMIKLWQNKVFLFAVLVFIIVASGLFVELYYPYIQLSANQKKWDMERPAAYFMKVRQRDSNGWAHWKAIVSDGVVLKANTQVQTVDQIFSRLEKDCVPRGFMDCGITFDSQFHYPTKADSYEMFYLEIEQFTPCDQDLEACFSAMESQ